MNKVYKVRDWLPSGQLVRTVYVVAESKEEAQEKYIDWAERNNRATVEITILLVAHELVETV